MKLDQLRAFVAVLELGSLSEAARYLRRDQPGVTRLIQALETEMGAQLLDRSTKPPKPTVRGLALGESARRVLEAVSEIEALARPRRRAALQTFSIGVSHATIGLLAQNEIGAWMRNQPRLALKVEAGWTLDLVERLKQRRLHAVFGPFAEGWMPAGALHGRCFGRDDMLLAAPRDMALPREISARTLTGLPWVLNPEGCGVRASVARAFAAEGRSLEPSVEVTGDFGALMEFVILGYGVTLVPRWLIKQHRHAERVQVRPLASPGIVTSLWLCWREQPALAVNGLADALAASLAHRL